MTVHRYFPKNAAINPSTTFMTSAPLSKEAADVIISETKPIYSFKELPDPLSYRELYENEEKYVKLLSPRRYIGQKNYDDPAAIGRHLASTLCNVLGVKRIRECDEESVARYQIRFVADELAKAKMPVYFIGEQLFDALLETDLPDDMKLGDIKWSAPAMMLMIPLGKLKTDHFSYTSIFVTKHDSSYTSPFTNEQIVPDEPFYRVLTIAPSWNSKDETPQYAFVQAAGTPNQVINEVLDSRLALDTSSAVGRYESKYSADAVSNLIFTVAIKILLLMQARPDLVEREPRLLRPLKVKHGRTRDALWDPNFLGRNYRYKRHPENAGTGTSPRTHFRRGHYRWQRHGKGLTERELLWIQESWINLNEETK
jgi:hypothetical protein